MCTQRTLLTLTKAVDEQDLEEERFEFYCQESQTDIESSYSAIEITL